MQPELIADCVHCGFCLPTCPTYSLWHEEMDSPRGRIYLMGGLVDGTMPLTDTVVEHFDRCLGCMACVPACPSGVQYDRLIEQTRDAHRGAPSPRRPVERLLRAADLRGLPAPAAPARRAARSGGCPRRARSRRLPRRTSVAQQRVAARAPAGRRTARRAAGRLRAERRLRRRERRDRARARRRGLRRARAAARRAAAARCTRTRDGSRRASRAPARSRDDLGGYDLIVTNAAGCGSHLKDHGVPNVVDVSELLVDPPARAERQPLPVRVAFQDSCHLRHAQRIASEPRAVLAGDPRARAARAGRAGDLLRQRRHLQPRRSPTAARELGDRKAEHVLATEPDAYASGNPGCLVQVTAALRRAGRPVPAFHPIELVDASIRGLDAQAVLASARR